MERALFDTDFLVPERRRALLEGAARERWARRPRAGSGPRRSLAALCFRLAAFFDERYVLAQQPRLRRRARFGAA